MPITLSDGNVMDLHFGRFDERQRRYRIRLPNSAQCWDYAPLIDVLRREPGFTQLRFTGLTARQWLDRLHAARSVDYWPYRDWYESVMRPRLAELGRRPRVPDNHYCIELARPPLVSSIPGHLQKLHLQSAAVSQWIATLIALTGQGLKTEELEVSGLLTRLRQLPGAARLTLDEVLDKIDLTHALPALACESHFAYVAAASWRDCCIRIPPKEYRRRGLMGEGREALHIIRYRHPSLAWSIVRTRYYDLLTPLSDWWSVLNEKGRFIEQPLFGFPTPEDAMAYAEYRMSQHYAVWGKSQSLPRWASYALPGGYGYRELLITLDHWPHDYQPRHYRTRNVLIHIRASIRLTREGRKVLYLDEVQSDWHADLHAAAKGQLSHASNPPPAPYRKEWPLLAMKMMLWWAQRLGVDGLAWSTAELQQSRWAAHGPPLLLYRKALPEAARALAGALSLPLESTLMAIRAPIRQVVWRRSAWRVCDRQGIPITKPFRHRHQAEHYADLTGVFIDVEVPVLWLAGLPRSEAIPLYGVSTLTNLSP